MEYADDSVRLLRTIIWIAWDLDRPHLSGKQGPRLDLGSSHRVAPAHRTGAQPQIDRRASNIRIPCTGTFAETHRGPGSPHYPMGAPHASIGPNGCACGFQHQRGTEWEANASPSSWVPSKLECQYRSWHGRDTGQEPEYEGHRSDGKTYGLCKRSRQTIRPTDDSG